MDRHRSPPATPPTSSRRVRARVGLLLLALLAAIPGLARAQDDTSSSSAEQIWLNAYLGKRFSERTYGRLDVEPQWQVSSGEEWRSFDVTPRVERYTLEWLDLLAEMEVGDTVQSDDQDSFELTPRVGVVWHIFARMVPLRGQLVGLEPRLSLSRVHVSTLCRLEWRNLFYSDDTPDSHEWRARFRLGGTLAINHPTLARDRTLYVAADMEYFLPLSGDVSERYVNKVRVRTGLGYRASGATRFEVLYVRDWNRDSSGADESQGVQALDASVTLLF